MDALQNYSPQQSVGARVSTLANAKNLAETIIPATLAETAHRMCQHFSGHKVKQIYTAIQIPRVTNNHCLNAIARRCEGFNIFKSRLFGFFPGNISLMAGQLIDHYWSKIPHKKRIVRTIIWASIIVGVCLGVEALLVILKGTVPNG